MNIPDNNFINNVINEFVSGNKEKALKKLHKHIKKNDGDVLAKYNYAYMQHQVGNIKTAIQYYTEVAELSKTQWKSRQNLALIYLDTKQYSKGFKVHRRSFTNKRKLSTCSSRQGTYSFPIKSIR